MPPRTAGLHHHPHADFEMFHYTDGGLRNVWLVNGYEIKETPYGQAVAADI